MPSETINIFVDLDETLIHTLGMVPFTKNGGYIELHEIEFKKPEPNEKYADTPVSIVLDKEVYDVVLRPGANYLLFRLREIGHVYMLTRATKDYARVMNKAFNFGFDEDKIFDREYVKDWKYKTPKVKITTGKSVLIDDLRSSDNLEKIFFTKRFGVIKYIEVPAFWGYEDESLTHNYIQELVENIVSS
jgi:hypothetical protein